MGLTVCPVATVAAPVEVVWANLTQWERYAAWAGIHVERIEPGGPAAVGQTIYFAGTALGGTRRFSFKVEELDPTKYQLGLLSIFPFGLVMKPHVSCTPIDATTCRVQYG